MAKLKTMWDDIPLEERPWIGFDLDGTLAKHPPEGSTESGVGSPIQAVVQRMISYVMKGYRVKIMTARAHEHIWKEQQVKLIKEWLMENTPEPCWDLEVTAEKDYGMIKLYDDRAVQVITDEGIFVGE